MDVLKFKIYKVTIDDEDKSNDTILAEAHIEFEQKGEKAFVKEAPLFLLPTKDIDEYVAKRQHDEALQYTKELINRRLTN